MIVRVNLEDQCSLEEYAIVRIAFEVREILDVVRDGAAGGDIRLVPRIMERPFVKDYDQLGEGGPGDWARRFDLSHWGIFVARESGAAIGGVAVVFGAPDVEMLAGQPDVALVWDLRVSPEHRGRGVGHALLGAAESWATARGARWLEVETQNVNAPACRFYAREGFGLRYANALAYTELPDEVQLLWYKRLREAPG